MDSPVVKPVSKSGRRSSPSTATALVRSAFRIVEWELTALRQLLLVPARVLILLDSAEAIVRRIDRITGEVGRILANVDGIVTEVGAAVDEARLTVRRANEIAADVEGTVERAGVIATDIDGTTARAGTVISGLEHTAGRADGMVTGIEATTGDAEALVQRVGPIVDFASETVTSVRPTVQALLLDNDLDPEMARRVADRFTDLVVVADQIAEQIRPFAVDISHSLTEENAEALTGLIDRIPELTGAVQTDVIPVLTSLDRVGPEVSEILEVAQNCLEALRGIPGFAYLRRRGGDRGGERGPDRG